MQRTVSFLFILAYIISFGAQAQQTVSTLTLEDLIPGGKTFSSYQPHIAEKFHWQGDRLIRIHNDSVFAAKNTAHAGKQTFLFHLKDLTKDRRDDYGKVFHIEFEKENDRFVRFFTDKGIGIYDLDDSKPERFFPFAPGSAHHRLSPDGSLLAYTIDNNLYIQDQNNKHTAVSDGKDKAIVYGQAVHRNEFGIDRGIFWSPDSKKLAFYRMDESMVTDYPLVDISTRIATLKNTKYPMAGMTSHQVTIGVFDTQTGTTRYLQTGEPADRYFTNIAWNTESNAIYVAEVNRGQNHLWLKRYEAVSGSLSATLFEETHAKYVEPEHPPVFVPGNGGQFIWQSRRDGYRHLYLYDTGGRLIRQLTKGPWEVTRLVGFDAKSKNVWFEAAAPSPIENHLFSVKLSGGAIKQHTRAPGTHSTEINRAGSYFIDTYSAHDQPGATALIAAGSGKRQELASAADPFEGLVIPSVEAGTIKAADNQTDLYYRLVKPTGFDASRRYPVVVYVYGGPHSQLVTNRWKYDARGWEIYMAQKGYLVFVMDNRGTSNRGIDFENVTHRRLGVVESQDQMKGVEFLQALPYVDRQRMGVHGWSYGGFMTINLLLRHPGVFKAGVAGGPVIDWKYYEVMYGERYMDTPQENPEGYAETSLLPKAGKLKDRLLIIHGDEDPTVVLQNSLQFLKASINAGTHPDYFIYPGHGHNMIGKDRVHLHEHITRYFDDHL